MPNLHFKEIPVGNMPFTVTSVFPICGPALGNMDDTEQATLLKINTSVEICFPLDASVKFTSPIFKGGTTQVILLVWTKVATIEDVLKMHSNGITAARKFPPNIVRTAPSDAKEGTVRNSLGWWITWKGKVAGPISFASQTRETE